MLIFVDTGHQPGFEAFNMEKIDISLISYLNSRPFLYGLENAPVREDVTISLDIPSKTAARLKAGLTDIGLVPVGALADLPPHSIISDFCIGAEGPVRTVVLASEVPLEEIETVLLDYQSRSSVLLTRVMANFFWKKNFRWENTCSGFEQEEIKGTTAGVVIGDRVFSIEKKYRYIYDLAFEWNKHTGLPFVFAVWVTTRKLPDSFLRKFNEAVSLGVSSIGEVEKTVEAEYPGVDIFEYFTKNISYLLTPRKREGMHLFLDLAGR